MQRSRSCQPAAALPACLLFTLLILPAPVCRAAWVRHTIDRSSRGADGVRLRDVNGDGWADVTTGWEEGGLTRAYLHPGPAAVRTPWPAVTVGITPAVEDAVFVDLDRDGMADIVSCCEGGEQRIHVHWGPAGTNAFLQPALWTAEPLPAAARRMRWMFASPVAIDGEPGDELVAAGKGEGAAVGWFRFPRKGRELAGCTWHEMSPCGWVMSLLARDMDGDGDLDIVLTDRKGPRRGCRWLEHPGGDGRLTAPWRSHMIGAAGREAMFMAMGDLDADGCEDVLVAVKPATVLWLRRTGGVHDRWEEHAIPYPPDTGRAKAVAVGDMDGDGCGDLVLSCEHATPPTSGVVWLSRDSEGVWIPHDISGPDGIKFDRLALYDLDRDGDLDVMTCEERHGGAGLGVIWYENPSRVASSSRIW